MSRLFFARSFRTCSTQLATTPYRSTYKTTYTKPAAAAVKPAASFNATPAKPADATPAKPAAAVITDPTIQGNDLDVDATRSFPGVTAEFESTTKEPVDTDSEAFIPFGENEIKVKEVDWRSSYHGISAKPFSKVQAKILMRTLLPEEIEIKPDGILYLPEIHYRRILNGAFGPGGWGMVPRSETTIHPGLVSREWGLVADGRLVSVARGEQSYFDPSGIATAMEGCKSNAMMRCCKDLGIASELWDPGFIRKYKAKYCSETWVENHVTKRKMRRWAKNDI